MKLGRRAFRFNANILFILCVSLLKLYRFSPLRILPVGLHFVDWATAHCFASKTVAIYWFHVAAGPSLSSAVAAMGPDRASSEILGNVTPRLPNEGRLEWKRYVNWNFLIKSSTWRLELNPAVFSVLEISSPMFLWWNKTPCRLPWLHKPAPVFRPQGKSRRKAPAWKRGISGLRRGPTCSRKWTDPARLPPADPRSSIPPASSFTYAGEKKSFFF